MIRVGNTTFNDDVKELKLKEFKEKYKGKLNIDLKKAWLIIKSEK